MVTLYGVCDTYDWLNNKNEPFMNDKRMNYLFSFG